MRQQVPSKLLNQPQTVTTAPPAVNNAIHVPTPCCYASASAAEAVHDLVVVHLHSTTADEHNSAYILACTYCSVATHVRSALTWHCVHVNAAPPACRHQSGQPACPTALCKSHVGLSHCSPLHSLCLPASQTHHPVLCLWLAAACACLLCMCGQRSAVPPPTKHAVKTKSRLTSWGRTSTLGNVGVLTAFGKP